MIYFSFQILTNPVLRIKDNEKANIKLKLTVPFGCNAYLRNNRIEQCAIELTLFIPDSSNLNARCEIFNLANLHRDDRPCGTRIKHDEVGKVKTISVTNQMGGQSNKKIQQFDVLLQTNYKYHDIINSYSLEPVKVNITL